LKAGEETVSSESRESPHPAPHINFGPGLMVGNENDPGNHDDRTDDDP
jgi:hypothetical protein